MSYALNYRRVIKWRKVLYSRLHMYLHFPDYTDVSKYHVLIHLDFPFCVSICCSQQYLSNATVASTKTSMDSQTVQEKTELSSFEYNSSRSSRWRLWACGAASASNDVAGSHALTQHGNGRLLVNGCFPHRWIFSLSYYRAFCCHVSCHYSHYFSTYR